MSAGSVQGQLSTHGATQHPCGQCHHGHLLLALATILGLGSPILSASGEGVFPRSQWTAGPPARLGGQLGASLWETDIATS